MELSRADNRKLLVFNTRRYSSYLFNKLKNKNYNVFKYTSKQGSQKNKNF